MKILFFATNSFPFGKQEPLINDQIRNFSDDFDRVFIISSDTKNTLQFSLPHNIQAQQCSLNLSFYEKILGWLNVFNKNIREELKFYKMINGKKANFQILKVLLNSYKISLKWKKFYKKILSEEKLENEQLFFHSYWCTEATIGFCLIKDEFPRASYYSRVHAYDLYTERHQPNYLPLRNLIQKNISRLFFISEQGLNYYKNKYQFTDDKLTLNRLGVQPLSQNNAGNTKDKFPGIRIVSCSSIIALKRLHLIVESLEKLNDINIEWVHFGDGNLEKELKKLIQAKLAPKSNITVILRGFCENDEIKNYYQNHHVDLFINTSQYEGLPISMMEAMMYAIPCIGTDVGGVKEIIQDQKNGFLLPVNFNCFALADIIKNYHFFNPTRKEEFELEAFKTYKEKFNGKNNSAELFSYFEEPLKECSRCLYNSHNYSSIEIDQNGLCNVCKIYDNMHSNIPNAEYAEIELHAMLQKIKADGKNKKYDCIIGLSGGVDSTYVAYMAKKWQLRPLIIHVDNGWNSELATQNIENTVKKLNFDLHTEVLNWEQIKDLQLSFFKASVIDIDVPFDNAINAVIFKKAVKFKIKHILSGINTVTEGWMPTEFSHFKLDTINIKAIHKKFGTVAINNFPTISPLKQFFIEKLFRIHYQKPLDLIEFNKEKVKAVLKDELLWRDYGGKHYENIFTKFYQGSILNEKFKFDKRISHYSTLICSGQISKSKAREMINTSPYNEEELEADKTYFIKKLGINHRQYEEILKRPIKKHQAYPSYLNIYNKLSRIKKYWMRNNSKI